MRFHPLRSLLVAANCLGLALAANPAQADPITDIQISFNNWAPGLSALGCSTSGPITACAGGGEGEPGATSGSGALTVTRWNLFLDADPTVSNFIAIQNNLAVAQTFTITVQIPIAPAIGAPITIQGSIVGGATDFNGNGVTLSNSTSSIYTALVDGNPVQTLLDSPQSYSAGSGGSVGFGPASFGPFAIGSPATTSIGITINFTLSPGDLASYTSVFTVTPEPGTLLLVGSGIAGLVAFGSRKRD